jgi:D-alanine-D-alanine ligase
MTKPNSTSTRRRLRILVLMHRDLVPPSTLDGHSEKEIAAWKTEYDVVTCLEDIGHGVVPLGVHDDLSPIREALEQFDPHITFNLLEEFHGIAAYNYSVVTFLELMRRPYTGCNPRGLLLSRDKALSRKILAFHRVPVPRFAVAAMGRKLRLPRKMTFPLIVKSLTDQGSLGISQDSVVRSDDKLAERVEFIHRHAATDAIVEEYIDGRELYVGVMGNQQLQTFPVWEMNFGQLPEGAPRIATSKVKWDEAYQKKIGLTTSAAENLPDDARRRLTTLAKRVYRILGLSGYARMDFRMSADGRVHVLEANPNPQLAFGEDFAESANHIGINYEQLLQRIVSLGLRFRPMWRA